MVYGPVTRSNPGQRLSPAAGSHNGTGKMGASKRYFSDQFRVNKITLQHDDAADFYLSCWQTSQSPIPLLCFRLVVFLGCLSILIASIALTGETMSLAYWPIYMTHWGVVMIAVTSGLAFLVSVMATLKGSIDSDGLPWYIQIYWVSFCVTVPAALFITVFYYALLANTDEEFAVDPILDLFIHGINSVAMVCLLAVVRHPVHLLQFLYPFLFTVGYLAFSIIYYYAGGTSPLGDNWIYPMLDWSSPGSTSLMVIACAVFLLVVHIIVVALTALRNWIVRKYVLKVNNFNISA